MAKDQDNESQEAWAREPKGTETIACFASPPPRPRPMPEPLRRFVESAVTEAEAREASKRKAPGN